MKFTLIRPDGSQMSFYLRVTAEIYAQLSGGTVVETTGTTINQDNIRASTR